MIRIKNDATWFFTVGDLKNSVRDWYMDTYPNDDLGHMIDKKVSFWDLVGLLNAGLGDKIYKVIGVDDSVIRERIFSRISKVVGCDYGTIYDTWICT